jgi:hypothetical protein
MNRSFCWLPARHGRSVTCVTCLWNEEGPGGDFLVGLTEGVRDALGMNHCKQENPNRKKRLLKQPKDRRVRPPSPVSRP